MNEDTKEVLLILQEECAEVEQAVCKAFRFGLDSRHEDGLTKKEELESEIGDLLCIIDILIKKAVLSDSNINGAKQKKLEKHGKH